MVDNYFVEVRRRNKIALFDFLQKNKDLVMDQALGQFSFRTGYKTSTLRMWVDEFVMAGMLKIEKGHIE